MNYIVLSIALFCIGVLGVLVRRSLIVILISIELMLSAANIAFVAFARTNAGLDGDVVVLFNFVIAACEAAVGLAIIVAAYRLRGSADISVWRELKR
jgi:NADH-quinone oxidoreductase subunit K